MLLHLCCRHRKTLLPLMATAICLWTGALALATEYSLGAYFIDAGAVASAIGSGDGPLQSALLADREYVADNGLEERYQDPQMWRRAVGELVAGQARDNTSINGFALELLFRHLTTPNERGFIGLPFVDLYTAGNFLGLTPQRELAALFMRVESGTGQETPPTLPATLRGKLGDTQYHARVSVVSHTEAAGFAKALAGLAPYVRGAEDVQSGHDSKRARRFLEVVALTATASWTEFAQDPSNLDEGETPAELVERMVASTLEDPYQYTQALESLSYEVDTLRDWLTRSAREKKDLFLVYRSY
ncbi:MAG: hypothetical protein ACK5HY_15435 [Parahaliea sp.]